MSYNKLGNVHRASVRATGPRVLRAILDSHRAARASREPERADYQRDLAVSYDKLGDVLRALGQGERPILTEAILTIRAARAGGARAHDYRRDLSVSYNKLGDVLRALGQAERARAFYELSLTVIERLAQAERARRLPA